MRKILLLLLIPLLSGTFVLKEDYEQRIDELEQRILALENVEDELLNYNNTIEKYLESEDMMLSMTVVVENGVITEYYACGDYCDWTPRSRARWASSPRVTSSLIWGLSVASAVAPGRRPSPSERVTS